MDNYIMMYEKLPNLVLGFHGCDISTYKKVLINHENLKASDNQYDWLGNGIYFWENSYQRACDWAKNNTKYEKPAVIGAVIDLGHCLNLTDYHSADVLGRGYEMLKEKYAALGEELPVNRKPNKNGDVLLRDLDCAVIQQIHQYHKETKAREYDSVRGVFIEGREAYPGAGFKEKTHIQLCIVNPNCIKGFFSPRCADDTYLIP